MDLSGPHTEGVRRRLYRIREYVLDLDSGFLLRGDEEIALRPKAFEVLAYLVQRPDRLITKAELIEAVWPETAITDNSLAQCLVEIRRALGDDSQQLIRTVARRGYVFNAPPSTAVIELHRTTTERSEKPAALALVDAAGQKRAPSRITIAIALLAAIASGVLLASLFIGSGKKPAAYTQLTNFPDAAVAPVLSPDGRMLAFIRGDAWFLSRDQIYIKLLPNGEPVQLTHDGRAKYAPAFSPDGSRLAFTLIDGPGKNGWATYTVSPFGGQPRILLPNASGLTWLDERRLMFSEIKAGIHMGVVTATEVRAESRDVYWPAHERMMAHLSYPSPDHKWVLIIEMNPVFQPCRVVPMEGGSLGRNVGPAGQCTSAGWSPDGKWMYFGVKVEGSQHLWRQRFPDGKPEQITSGPTEEDGVAVEPDGRSLITSIGMHQSAIWLHEPGGERQITSEGFVIGKHEGFSARPIFSRDGKSIYYLLRRESPDSARVLWRADIESGKAVELLPGISINEYDISSDGREVVFSMKAPGDRFQICLARLDRSTAPRVIGTFAVDGTPHFGPSDEVLFRHSDGKANYLYRMNRDGSAFSKVTPYQISTIRSISPDRRWLLGIAPNPAEMGRAAVFAIPISGGAPRRICAGCAVHWAPNGKFLFVSVQAASRNDRGKAVALPALSGDTLPALPSSGIQSLAEGTSIPGAIVIDEEDPIPSSIPTTYAYVKETTQRNLFRIPLR